MAKRLREYLGSSYLFNVQEVFGFEGYGHALHRNVITGAGVVTDICPHSKRHRFGLQRWWERHILAYIQRPLDTVEEVYQCQNTRHWCKDYATRMTIKLTLCITDGRTTVELWPLLSRAWRGPVCRPPSSEPQGPPPGTRLSPTAGWCRSLQSPEMHNEFT